MSLKTRQLLQLLRKHDKTVNTGIWAFKISISFLPHPTLPAQSLTYPLPTSPLV